VIFSSYSPMVHITPMTKQQRTMRNLRETLLLFHIYDNRKINNTSKRQHAKEIRDFMQIINLRILVSIKVCFFTIKIRFFFHAFFY
jgi:hypothetical protein